MKLAGLTLALMLTGAPAIAKWSVVPANNATPVASGSITIIPSAGWNRWSKKTINKGELWSFDGPLLNKLEFIGGVAQGEALAPERNKKRDPLPKFEADMKSSDVADLVEQTVRHSEGAPDFTMETVEPADFGGHRGFRLVYRYTVGELVKRAEARGAVVDGKLFMISFSAPALHYFEQGRTNAQAVMASARIGK